MKKSRAFDKRRYDFEAIMDRQPTEEEKSLLSRYTTKEVVAMIKAKEEILSGNNDILSIFKEVL